VDDLEIADDHPDYVVHKLASSDTLEGLALRFNSSISELQRINQLFDRGSLQFRTFIYVPRMPGSVPSSLPPMESFGQKDKKLQALASLKNRVNNAAGPAAPKMMTEEATVYLEDTDYDVEAAFNNYLDDMAWAKQQGNQPKRMLKPSNSPATPKSPASTLGGSNSPLLGNSEKRTCC
jgi:hypothetical protein